MPKKVTNYKSKSDINKDYNQKHRWKCDLCDREYSPTQKKVHLNSMKHKYKELESKSIDS